MPPAVGVRLFAVALSLPIWSGPAGASAWLQKPGAALTISTFRTFSTGGAFDDQGLPIAGSKYHKDEIDIYSEYGLTRGITIGLEPRYQWATSGSGAASAHNSGPGDVDGFLRFHLLNYGRWVSALQLGLKIPAYGRARQPAAGNARKEAEFRLAIGRNMRLMRLQGFVDIEAAYRKGTQGLADQIREEATAGIKIWPRVQILLKGYRAQSLGNGDGRADSRIDLYKVETSVLVRLYRSTSLELGAGREASDLSAGAGTSIFAAIWARF